MRHMCNLESVKTYEGTHNIQRWCSGSGHRDSRLPDEPATPARRVRGARGARGCRGARGAWARRPPARRPPRSRPPASRASRASPASPRPRAHHALSSCSCSTSFAATTSTNSMRRTAGRLSPPAARRRDFTDCHDSVRTHADRSGPRHVALRRTAVGLGDRGQRVVRSGARQVRGRRGPTPHEVGRHPRAGRARVASADAGPVRVRRAAPPRRTARRAWWPSPGSRGAPCSLRAGVRPVSTGWSRVGAHADEHLLRRRAPRVGGARECGSRPRGGGGTSDAVDAAPPARGVSRHGAGGCRGRLPAPGCRARRRSRPNAWGST